MRENTGSGWVDRGPRVGVPGWDGGASPLPRPKYGPGSRKAITNSQAREISQMQYNGSSDEDDEYESYE